jgi:hypothetical protein
MRRRWVIFAFVFMFAISALIILIGYSLLPSSQQDMAQPWIFKGAYATYTGQVADVSTQTTLSARIEVTDINATHVQVRTSSTIAPPSGPEVDDHFTLWINKANISFQPPGEALARSYSTQITLNNSVTRDCTVYEYTNEAINATYYVDNALQWPIRLVYMTGFENQTYTIDFNLNSTNIKALDEAFLA